MPLKPESVDIAFSYIVFQHITTYEMIEKNFISVKKALKKDGIFKVQLRGKPIRKGEWYSGEDFDIKKVENLCRKTGFRLLRYDGLRKKYFWLWLKKDA